MEQLTTLEDLNRWLGAGRAQGHPIGFVPTMGALHIGHKSLITKAKETSQRVLCSIFVNPTQFNEPADLEKYPRTPQADFELLKAAGCDAVFTPLVHEIYPTRELLDMDFGSLALVMEGAFRPGHFQGMATVVARFFDLVRPDRAYFGEKDFQQLAIVRELARRMFPGTEVIGCATVREPDGLAFSSRNVHLTPVERAGAPVIFQSLEQLRTHVKEMPVAEALGRARSAIEGRAGFQVQYLELVDAQTLAPVSRYPYKGDLRACTAVLTAATRLIDNVAV